MERTSALNGNGIYKIRFWNDIYLCHPYIQAERLIIANKKPTNYYYQRVDYHYWWYIEGSDNDLVIKPAIDAWESKSILVYDWYAVDV